MIFASGAKPSRHAWLCWLTLTVAVSGLLFAYPNTVSEPDLVRMMAGIVYGGVTGQQIFAGYHYGIEFSFGFYQALYHLLPEAALRDPDRVAQAINQLGLAMAFLLALGLCLMLEKLIGRVTALFCAILFLFSPLGWPFVCSGHPMIGACAFLFLAAWLLLRSLAYPKWLPLLLHLAFMALLLLISLTLRAEIALAFPFVGLAWLLKSPLAWKQRILAGVLPLAAMLLAVGGFLYLQRPFVLASGGAIQSIGAYIADFSSNQRVIQGLGVMTLAFGSVSALVLAGAFGWTFAYRLKLPFSPREAMPNPLLRPLLIPLFALILPSLLFWISIPQPARHFIIPVLGLCLLLGLLLANRLRTQTQALVLGFLLVAANQTVAELVLRPLIVKHYPWSYQSDSARRTSQRMTLGFFPLDQQGNIAAEALLKQEAIQLATQAPEKLLILADSKFYIVAQLLAADPQLRLQASKVGNFDALLISRPGRNIYMVEKYTSWPKDVLAEILTLPEFATYPVHVQKATLSHYDKTPLPAARQYLPKIVN